jgi:hypothetical protein
VETQGEAVGSGSSERSTTARMRLLSAIRGPQSMTGDQAESRRGRSGFPFVGLQPQKAGAKSVKGKRVQPPRMKGEGLTKWVGGQEALSYQA